MKEDILEKITYGFYIVTTRVGREELSTREKDYIAAGTVSWLMQTSFEPPMVAVAIQKDSDLNETMGRSGVFAVNILGKDDRSMVDDFSGDSNIKAQQINGYTFLNGAESGCPILERGLGFIECRIEEIVDTKGDHVLFVGKIINNELREPEHLPLHEWETGKHYGGFIDS